MLGHELRLRASRWLPTDETLIPTGELAGVAGTPMDFRTSKPLGRDIRADFPALRYGKGYDNCWAVDDWRADEEMNRPDFPSAELRPGEAYRRTIRFRFDVR